MLLLLLRCVLCYGVLVVGGAGRWQRCLVLAPHDRTPRCPAGSHRCRALQLSEDGADKRAR